MIKTTIKPVPLNPTETYEQTTVVTWLERRGYTVFAVPNGGLRTGREAKKLEREGVRAGAPDLILVNMAPVNGRPVMIEMKRKRGGQYSPEQLKMHEIARREKWNVITCPPGKAGVWVIEQLQQLGFGG
jgi:hypothetical protein